MKPFWSLRKKNNSECGHFSRSGYYPKIMAKSIDNNISVFVWRIQSTIICIVAKRSSFSKKKEIIP